jgi:DNA-binding protein YbaB
MSSFKRPTVRRPTRTPTENVVLVMPNFKWSKLAGYKNGSTNLYHNNRSTGLRTIIRLARNQTLKQYFNTHKGFPTGTIPMPGYVLNNRPLEAGEIRRAVPRRAPVAPARVRTPVRNQTPLRSGNFPETFRNTPAAKQLLKLNNNIIINQYGTFLNNTTARNLVARAITKTKLKEVLTKNLNDGVKKMQAKMKNKSNARQADLNRQRAKIVRLMVGQIMKRVTYQPSTQRVNLTARKRAVPEYVKIPKRSINLTTTNYYKRLLAEFGGNNARAAKVLKNLMTAGLVNENNLFNKKVVKPVAPLTNNNYNSLGLRGLFKIPRYEDPARPSESLRVTTKKPTNKQKTVKTAVTRPAQPASPPKPSKRAQKPPMANVLAGTKKPALAPPKIPRARTEELIKQAINKVVNQPKAWVNEAMQNHTYKRGPGVKLGGKDCETKTKEELVGMLRKYGYTREIPKFFTKAVICQKLKTIHNGYKGGSANSGNNNHMKELLKKISALE